MRDAYPLINPLATQATAPVVALKHTLPIDRLVLNAIEPRPLAVAIAAAVLLPSRLPCRLLDILASLVSAWLASLLAAFERSAAVGTLSTASVSMDTPRPKLDFATYFRY